MGRRRSYLIESFFSLSSLSLNCPASPYLSSHFHESSLTHSSSLLDNRGVPALVRHCQILTIQQPDGLFLGLAFCLRCCHARICLPDAPIHGVTHDDSRRFCDLLLHISVKLSHRSVLLRMLLHRPVWIHLLLLLSTVEHYRAKFL